MDLNEKLKIKEEIGELIENGLSFTDYDELLDKILQNHPKIDEEDFLEIYGEVVDETKATLPPEKPKSAPKPQKKTLSMKKKNEEQSSEIEDPKLETTATDSQQIIENPEISQEIEQTITDAEQKEFEGFSESIEVITKERGDFNIQAYAKIRFEELVSVLSLLVTPQHFVDIKGKKFPTALVSHDLISMSKNWEILTDDKDIYTPNNDHIIRIKVTIIDHNRNLTVQSYAQDYICKHIYDGLKKTDKYEYDDRALEKATTRAIRNTVNRLVPKKILDLIYAKSLELSQQLTAQKRALMKKTTAKSLSKK